MEDFSSMLSDEEDDGLNHSQSQSKRAKVEIEYEHDNSEQIQSI